MKNSRNLRKALTMVCCAMLLVAISVGATVAYLTSTDEVTNTFTVGKVAITLDEGDVYEFGDEDIPADKEHGKHIDDGETRVKENTYKLFPGHEYDKDPTVHVDAASEDCWVFVQVVNEIAAIEADTKIHAQIIANGWTELETGVYYKEAAAGDDLVVFETVTIAGTVDNATLEDYAGKTVKVTAYAIQKDGIADAATAWAFGNGETGGWN